MKRLLLIIVAITVLFQQNYALSNFLDIDNNDAPSITSIKYIKTQDDIGFTDFLRTPIDSFNDYSNESLESGEIYWLLIDIQGAKPDNDNYFLLFNSFISDITLYQQNEDSSYTVCRSGAFVPLNLRTQKGYLKDKVAFKFSSTHQARLILRIRNDIEKSFNLKKIELVPEEQYREYALNVNFFQGAFIGMMVILFLVNFILFWFARNKVYLYYALYLFLIALFFFNYYQFTEVYFLADYPKTDFLIFFSVFLAQFVYLLFFLELLKNEDVPLWREYVKHYAKLIFVLFLTIIVFAKVNYSTSIIISDIYTFLNASFVILSFFIFFKKVNLTTKIVLVGALIMVIGALITTIISFSKVTVEEMIYYQMGVFVELVLFSVAINYTYINDHLKNVRVLYQNSLLRMEQLRREQENLVLKYQLDNKNREIVSQSIRISEKESLISDVVNRLSTFESNREQNISFKGLIANLQFKQAHNSWKEFEMYFKEIHPDFYTELNKKHPNLTSNERRLCSFMKLNLSTKEICAITGRSINTIDVARSRLRRKLCIEAKENLNSYINSIN